MNDRSSDMDAHRLRTLEEALAKAERELAACRAAGKRTAGELNERVKELTCLYAVSSLLQPSTNPEEVMPEVLEHLRRAYQFPEITSACIQLDEQSYCTEGHRPSPWRQAAVLRMGEQPIGSVEVFYAEERPVEDEGPFLIHERRLIDTVADLLSRYILRMRALDALYRREQDFEALAERSPDIIARIDHDGRILYINPAIEKVTGMERNALLGRHIDALVLAKKEDAALRREVIRRVFTRGEEQVVEHTHATASGERHFQSRLVPEFSAEGKVESALVVDRDITELKQVQQSLEDLTLRDPLTGVANRRFLAHFVEREWRAQARHRHTVAMIMVDIDHFKVYNDHYGHPQGDESLRRVAQTLQNRLRRPSDLLVRYGGEEFVVVLPETDLAHAIRIAEAMRQDVEGLALPHPRSLASPVLTISLGVVAAPAHAFTFDALLDMADKALYKAKEEGRNRSEARIP